MFYYSAQVADGHTVIKGVTTPVLSALPIQKGLTTPGGAPGFPRGDYLISGPSPVFDKGDPVTPGV